ncbi:hypothetical protein GH714_021717 [Hevea brasiliensis]|uniref:Uncharacterized protein n=1 Tax=Hevea brasiliensis TaxID=3981 RepID=A0A6A6M5C6_HEVBR|nr:hypothetical protein GH714_021717 [Hevea brasiliensis]
MDPQETCSTRIISTNSMSSDGTAASSTVSQSLEWFAGSFPIRYRFASLCVAGFTAIAGRKMVKTEMTDAEPMAKPSPFSSIEIWSWSGILLVSFVAALFYPTSLGTAARTCLPFLLASTVLGYMVEVAAVAFGYLSRFGLDPVLGYYLTKVSSNPGAGDVLMGFLGSVILSFAFSIFKQRKDTIVHTPTVVSSVAFHAWYPLSVNRLVKPSHLVTNPFIRVENSYT